MEHEPEMAESSFDVTPSSEELASQQGVQPIADPTELLGDFWPEDESIDDFLATLRRWRGHTDVDQAA